MMAMNKIFLLLLSLCSLALANEISVGFSETDRSVKEDEGPCVVTVVKEGLQSGDLHIRARALTFDEYRKMVHNSDDMWKDRSPAEMDTSAPDFIRKETTIVFPASDGFRQFETVSVELVVDNIYEENESFLVFMDIEDVHKSDSVKFTRNPILCEIRNDDEVAIGFEMTSYTFVEGAEPVNQVYLVKRDGQRSQLDLEINVGSIEDTAKHGEDYSFWVRSVTFPAGVDRIGLPIDIMDDSITEGDETFRLHISNNDGPTFRKDNSLTTITIKDRVIPPTDSPSPSPEPSPTSDPSPSPEGPSETPCEDGDIPIAVGLTFLVTFLLTALAAAIICILILICDRSRRKNKKQIPENTTSQQTNGSQV